MKRLSLYWLLCVMLAVWCGDGLPASEPDERVLWQLFHAGRIRLLLQAIRDFEQRYPDWTPPADLMRGLESRRQGGLDRIDQQGAVGNRIGAAIRRQDWPELIRLAKAHPALFACSRPGHLRVLAMAYARVGNTPEAALQYRKVLACPRIPKRDVLEEAFWGLTPAEFHKVLASVRTSIPASEFADFDYRRRRKALKEAYHHSDWQQFETLANKAAGGAYARHDLPFIAWVAWIWHGKQDWEQAAWWFHKGLALAPDDISLAQGLLTASIHLELDQQVLVLAKRYGKRHSSMRKQAAGYFLERAWQFYRQKRFHESRDFAVLAHAWLPDPAPAEFLLAWLDLEAGAYTRAQRRFEVLYRQNPDNREYARALVTSYLRAGDDLDRLAREFHEDRLVQTVLAPYRSQQSFDRKQFLRARYLDPRRFPELENIDSVAVDMAGLYRFKSGNSGLDRLHTFFTPFMQGRFSSGLGYFNMSLGLQVLQSGRLQVSGIRTLQASDQPLSTDQLQVLQTETHRLRSDLPTKAVEAAWMELSYRREGPFNPYVSIGLTPVGGPLAPRPTFRLGIGDGLTLTESGWQLRWNTEAYRVPVRQSLLSFTGWKMLGERWGRVVKTGTEWTGWLQPGRTQWSFYQSLDVALLAGNRTKNNWTIGYALAPGYDLRLKGFDYFTLGPYFNFRHYGNNQNHFRLGHGGYFSPQEFYAGGMQLGMLTREGRKFVIEGRLGVGVQYFRERKEAWYPRGCGTGQALCSSNPDYPPNRETSFAPSGRLRFVWQVQPHLQLAGGMYGQRTSGYNEFGAGLSLRWLFDSRPAVFSRDLPGYLFGVLQ